MRETQRRDRCGKWGVQQPLILRNLTGRYVFRCMDGSGCKEEFTAFEITRFATEKMLALRDKLASEAAIREVPPHSLPPPTSRRSCYRRDGDGRHRSRASSHVHSVTSASSSKIKKTKNSDVKTRNVKSPVVVPVDSNHTFPFHAKVLSLTSKTPFP